MSTTQHRIRADVLTDSVTPAGYRLTTWVVEFPWVVLPEVLTHRELSRNFASLRAVPQAKLISAVREAPFFFAHLGLAQKGMQALEEELEGDARRRALMWWHELAQDAAYYAERLASLDLHKQSCNRALMPFLYAKGVISATSRGPGKWPAENFFGLRCRSTKVEPHMHELAWAMADAVAASTPVPLLPGEAHLPFIKKHEHVGVLPPLLMASAMRCARVSYGTIDGLVTTVEEDAKRAAEALMSPGDLHGSPFEHQATAPEWPHVRSGNFIGWAQHRQALPTEYTPFSDADYKEGRRRELKAGILVDWKDEVTA